MPDICKNYHRGNPLSVAANPSQSTKRRDRERIWAHIAAAGPMTCDEVEVALGMRHQTASARIAEMKADGRLKPTGVRRATRGGKAAAELRAV